MTFSRDVRSISLILFVLLSLTSLVPIAQAQHQVGAGQASELANVPIYSSDSNIIESPAPSQPMLIGFWLALIYPEYTDIHLWYRIYDASQGGGNSTTTARYVHTDHLTGSSVLTDENGEQEQLLDYFPYGSVRINDQTGSYNELIQYAGSRFDEDTGLNYMGVRYYSGTVGRFTSQDPAHLLIGNDQEFRGRYNRSLETHLSNPQSLNSYSYVNNNPLRYIDDTGEIIPLLAVWAGVELALSAYDAYQTYKSVADANVSTGEKIASVSLFLAGVAGPGGGYKTAIDKGSDLVNSGKNLGKLEREVLKHGGYDKHAVKQAEWGTPPINESEYVNRMQDTKANFDVKARVQKDLPSGRTAGKIYYGNTKTGEIIVRNTESGKPTFFIPKNETVIQYIKNSIGDDLRRGWKR